MKKKNPKDNKGKKVAQPPNSFVPQNLLNLIREQKLITCPDNMKEKKIEYHPEVIPYEIPEEWIDKSEEEINNELFPEELIKKEKEKENMKTIERTLEKKLSRLDKKKEKAKKEKEKDTLESKETKEIKEDNNHNNNINVDKKENEEIKYALYEDKMHEELINNLPLSFLKLTKNNFKWIRPDEYITNEMLDKEIKILYPKKKYIQMREDIKLSYETEKLNKIKTAEKDINISEEENVDDLMNDNSETLKKTIYKDFYKLLDAKKKPKIVNFTERDETEEEYNKRVNDIIEKQKESLNRYKASKDKKGEKPIIQKPEDFTRIKIYNLHPNNLDVKHLVLKEKKCNSFKEKNEFRINYTYISFLTSVFQNILDLNIQDCNTSKSIMSNIYPQKNGSPLYNPNGHYVIKLYFMGKPRRIDLDDRMPCNINGEYILPRCENLDELWPALFTKALMKLNIYKVRHPFYERNEENIDISYLYALTGYHTQLIQDINIESQIENLLKNNLNDDNYLHKKKYILCLNFLSKKTEGKYYEEIVDIYQQLKEENAKKEEMLKEEDENEKRILGSRKITGVIRGNKLNLEKVPKTQQRKSLISTEFKFLLGKDSFGTKDLRRQRKEKKQKTIAIKGKLFLENQIDILYNFAYSINDFFSNDNFNMARLKILDFEDLKRNLRANNVIYKQLSSVEKREFFKRRKVLKDKQLEIKNQRIKEIQKEGKPFFIIKIKSNSENQYKINSVMTYTEDEINMAKKCILNKWSYPPPDFFNKYFKRYEKNDIDEESKEKTSRKKKKISSLDFTRDNYIQLIGDEMAKFENENIKEPLLKSDGGNWISFSDFNFLFNTFLVLHNPNNLFNGGKISIDDNWLDYKLDCFELKDEYNVIMLNKEKIENKEKLYNCFIIFEPNNDINLKGKDKIDNYIIFDIYDENNNLIATNITLNKFYSTHIVENLSGNLSYYILIKGGIYQLGFYLQFYSEAHFIESMNYQNYLSQALNYKYINFKFEHPYISNENFYLLTRLHITPNINEENEDKNFGEFKIIFNIKYPIKYLKKYMQIYIQREDDKGSKYHKGKEVFINELIKLKEGNYLIAIYFKNINGTIKENNGEIDISYSNNNYTINQIENIDYYEIGDKYKQNKYNIIFKEKIFTCDTIYTSLYIELYPEKEISEYNIKYLLYQLGDKDNKNIDLLEHKFAYGIRGTLIHKFESYHSLIIPSIKFKGGLIIPEKKASKNQHQVISPENQFFPYLLICYIDSPFCLKMPNLTWKIKIFSSDNICFVPDSSKEENELLMKNAWEEQEPGRANLAKMSRKRFLLEKMRKEGAELKNEDKEILNNKRIRKTTKEKEEEQNQIVGNKPGKKKIEKSNKNPATNNNKKEENNLNGNNNTNIIKFKTYLNINKTLPSLKDIEINHKSIYIKNYLKYANKERTLRLSTIQDQYLKIINNEKVSSEKSKKISESVHSFDKIFKTEMSNTFYKTQQDEMLSTFYKNDISTRNGEYDSIKELIKSRDSLKTKFKERINAENSVKDILKNYILLSYDYNYMLQVYKDTIPYLGKDNEDEIKLLKLISSKKEEEIKNQLKKFTAKDKNNITKLIEEIEFNQLNISEEIMSKLREFIK